MIPCKSQIEREREYESPEESYISCSHCGNDFVPARPRLLTCPDCVATGIELESPPREGCKGKTGTEPWQPGPGRLITVEDVLSWKPCNRWPRARIKAFVGSGIAPESIMAIPREHEVRVGDAIWSGLVDIDKIWTGFRIMTVWDCSMVNDALELADEFTFRGQCPVDPDFPSFFNYSPGNLAEAEKTLELFQLSPKGSAGREGLLMVAADELNHTTEWVWATHEDHPFIQGIRANMLAKMGELLKLAGRP